MWPNDDTIHLILSEQISRVLTDIGLQQQSSFRQYEWQQPLAMQQIWSEYNAYNYTSATDTVGYCSSGNAFWQLNVSVNTSLDGSR